MGILLGLTAALAWGVADYMARFATRRVGTYRTLFFMQVIGFAALSAWLAAAGGIGRFAGGLGWKPWAWAILAGLLNTLSTLALYRSFEVGVLALVSPIASSYPVLTVVLSLLGGEILSRTRGLGIGVALVGVVLAATSFTPASGAQPSEPVPHRKGKLARGVGWAIGAAFGYGILFWLLGVRVAPALGGFVSVWVIRVTTFCTLGLFALPARQSLRPPRGDVWWLIAGIGIIDTVAFVANNVALKTEQIAVASVLASLYGAVTVLLAWLFLRERLQWSQWLGVALIFLGVALVSV